MINSASQWAMLVPKNDGVPTPLSLDSLPMKTFAVGVDDFALENLSTTLQALRDVFDSFVPRVYPPQPNRCTSWNTYASIVIRLCQEST